MIVFWLLLTMYAVGGLVTFRRTGHMYEIAQRERHKRDGLCSVCKCANCGDYAKYHRKGRSHSYYGTGCLEYHAQSPVHGGNIFLMLPITLALWHVLALGYGGYQVKKALGLNAQSSFFVAPPELKSKSEREQAKIEARQMRLAELDKAITEAEAESDRQLARQRALGINV